MMHKCNRTVNWQEYCGRCNCTQICTFLDFILFQNVLTPMMMQVTAPGLLQTWPLVSSIKSGNTVWHLAKNLIKIYNAIEVCDTGYVRVVFISLSCSDCTSENYMFQSWVIVPCPSDKTFYKVFLFKELLLPEEREREWEGGEGGWGGETLFSNLLSCHVELPSSFNNSLRLKLIAVTSGDWPLLYSWHLQAVKKETLSLRTNLFTFDLKGKF